MSYRNIECLMANALEWVEQWDPMKGGSFCRTSADGGRLSLGVGDIQHDGLFYRALKIKQVTIPAPKRGKGLYSFFVHRLEDTAFDFGAIWHEAVDSPILIDRHTRYQLQRRGKSFFKITGSPHPKSLSCGMSWLHAVPVRMLQ